MARTPDPNSATASSSSTSRTTASSTRPTPGRRWLLRFRQGRGGMGVVTPIAQVQTATAGPTRTCRRSRSSSRRRAWWVLLLRPSRPHLQRPAAETQVRLGGFGGARRASSEGRRVGAPARSRCAPRRSAPQAPHQRHRSGFARSRSSRRRSRPSRPRVSPPGGVHPAAEEEREPHSPTVSVSTSSHPRGGGSSLAGTVPGVPGRSGWRRAAVLDGAGRGGGRRRPAAAA